MEVHVPPELQAKLTHLAANRGAKPASSCRTRSPVIWRTKPVSLKPWKGGLLPPSGVSLSKKKKWTPESSGCSILDAYPLDRSRGGGLGMHQRLPPTALSAIRTAHRAQDIRQHPF